MNKNMVYKISYYNAILGKNYKATTSNPIVLKAFLSQLSSNKCIATISGGSETIYEYADPDYSDMGLDVLLLYHSEATDMSLYLTTLMIDDMEGYVRGEVEYMARQLPDNISYHLMMFTKGSFKNKLLDIIIPAIYLFCDDDLHLDTVNTICSKELFISPKRAHSNSVFSFERGWL